MERKYVRSTTMRSIGYDYEQQILEKKFIDEEVYRYFGVPVQIYEGLMNADSKGKYLNEVFKKENYTFRKIS